MTDKIISVGDDPFFDSYADDYALSVAPDVPEVYGPKINIFHNDREVRIAFGRLYPHRRDVETIDFRPRYSVAVYMPVASAVELYLILRGTLKGKGMLPPDDPPESAPVADATPVPNEE